MTTDLMTEYPTPQTQPQTKTATGPRKNLEPTLRDILDKARTNRPAARGAWLCSGLTAVLMWAAFTPLDWGWLGWICLVPVCLLIRIETRTAWMYRAIYLTAAASSLAMLQWMRLGDPTMYPAWWALSFYVAMYLPVFVWLSRTAVHRFRVPLLVAVPVVWVALEFLRAYALTGFSWYYLGHTQYRWLELIQISDVTGAYGVSFLLAMSAAVIAGLVPQSLFRRWKLVLETRLEQGQIVTPRRPGLTVVCFGVLFASVWGYGIVRRGQAEFTPGPRVALIQGNFPSSVKHDPNAGRRIFAIHNELTSEAVLEHPDLIVWPETMLPQPIMQVDTGLSDDDLAALVPPEARSNVEEWVRFWRSHQTEDLLLELSQRADAALMIGVEAHVAHKDDRERFNSAVFVHPRLGIEGRYDKMHRVIFGEYIPLKGLLPGLHRMTPFSSDFGIAAGTAPKSFRYADWTFSPVICFEDTVPRVVRSAARSGSVMHPVDCLVNLTNDGWFHGSSELEQHLITSVFRAVECRKPLVRAVNTGISAFVDGDGAILEPDEFMDGETGEPLAMKDPRTGAWTKSCNALLVQTVPLDNRNSVYLQSGDVFAGSCGGLVFLLLVGGLIPRRRPSGVTPEKNAA